ncbi:MAG: hypothetical protein NZ533_07430 [Casimicrobiaceae bacterium]|nr:hypothetical protein [Casimicrobiaceae bacterium]MDW8312635.1 hypothetical protein [Burkholderiales bacterium]
MLEELAAAVAATALAQWVRVTPLAYPVLEVLHLWAIAIVFGSIVFIDLRILGIGLRNGGAFPVDAWARALLPWTLGAFALAVLSGALMFLSRAADFVSNPAFAVKLTLIVLAALNAALLHLRDGLRRSSPVNRWQAILSIGCWLGVMAAGRWIAYV